MTGDNLAAQVQVIHGDAFGNWDYAHFDQLTAQTVTANTRISDTCPLCCTDGVIGTGDADNKVKFADEPKWQMMAK